jgi:predicted kinase
MNLTDPLSVVDGLPAATAKVAGLTFATQNVADVEGSGGELVDVDRFFFFIRSGFIEPWDPASGAQNQLVMRTAAEAAANYAIAGYTTVIEGIVIPRWTLGVVRETLEAREVPAAYAVLRAPEALCAGRVQEREGDPRLISPRVLEAISSEFDDLGEFERHAIDVSEMDAEQAAAALSERLAAGTLDL